jgi:guanine deaminase
MDTRFMALAVQSAQEGIRANEGGPFGACVVRGGKVISTAHNTVLRDQDPTCHAEMNAIRAACKILNKFNLSDCQLYTTAEPCPMCLAGIYWARIDQIYVGVTKDVAAQFGFDDAEFYSELTMPHDHRRLKCEVGLLNDQCSEVFKEWKALGRQLY